MTLITHIRDFNPPLKQTIEREAKVALCLQEMGSGWILHPANYVDKQKTQHSLLTLWLLDRI